MWQMSLPHTHPFTTPRGVALMNDHSPHHPCITPRGGALIDPNHRQAWAPHPMACKPTMQGLRHKRATLSCGLLNTEAVIAHLAGQPIP